uniref:Uncharacterized protein n=1 Tax=Solanum lycopersicum TaxID=4081 RepID=A0A3Q7IDZ6_SOLLC
MGTFKKLGFKQIVKTTEETITVDSDHGTFRLLSENAFAPYRDNYKFMHIGLVQVAFKPLTLRGLPESFIAALRDGRNQNWKKSLIGTVQTSLAYGPAPDGTVKVKFTDQNLLMSYTDNIGLQAKMPRSNYSYISPADYVVNIPSRASTSQIRDEENSRSSTFDIKENERIDNIKIENHIVTPDMDEPTLSEMNFPNGSGHDDSGGEESHTSEDLTVLHDESYISSSDGECMPCQIGESCEDKQNTDEFYKLYSQFKDLNLNVISSDDWIEMIKLIDDPIIRSQIIDKMGSTSTNKVESPRKEIQTENTTYTMAELKRQLHKSMMRPSWTSSSNRGKGRGRGGRTNNNVLAQVGNQRLIAANITKTSALQLAAQNTALLVAGRSVILRFLLSIKLQHVSLFSFPWLNLSNKHFLASFSDRRKVLKRLSSSEE